MLQIRFFGCVLLLVGFIGIVEPICVLESDFGFKINCAFKKSGLFRVRNLGGIKAHASLGFSLGDELGFEQSLTNLDPSRRRSVSVKNGAPNLLADTSRTKQEKRGKQNRIMMRPVAPPNTRPNQAAMDKLTSLHRRVSSTMQPIIVSGPTVKSPTTLPRVTPTVTMAKPLPMGVPPFKPLPPKEDTMKVVPITNKYSPLQIPESKGPGLAYQSEIHPQSYNQISKMVSQMTAVQYGRPRITPTPIIVEPYYSLPTTVNPFVPLPVAPMSVAPISPPPTQALTIIPAPAFKRITQTNPSILDFVPHRVHDIANNYAYNTKKVDDYNTITGYSDDTILKFNKEDINTKIAEIAKAGNISMEAVEAAIALRQQQLLNKYANLPAPTTTTTTTSTTVKPVVFQPDPEPEVVITPQKPKRVPTSGKVMNAPREYYPVGYEKNFDDHFQSKVDLPDTSFHCGDQKYFPGLYGDESLGCMVFHVCALTDDGLVMKSFLCPESTLFDQTILKCNWWFYVDCKNTRKLYDTNIPVSKSYQLMKALTFFSSYKKEMEDGRPKNPEDVEGIKEAISILENQDNSPQQSAQNVQIITPTPLIDERNNKNIENTEPAPVYRNHRNINNTNIRNDARRNINVTNIKNTNQDVKFVTRNKQRNVNLNSSPKSTNSNEEVRFVVRNDAQRNVNPNSNADSTNSNEKVTSNDAQTDINLNTNAKSTNSNEEVKFVPRNNAQTNTNLNTNAQSTNSNENIKLITVKAGFNFNDSSESRDRKYRRRMTLKLNSTTPITSTPSKLETTTPTVEIIKQNIESIENIKQETLADQIEEHKNYDLPEVKRFYRSSAENKEITVVNNEKIHIVRPTPVARHVGNGTPKSAITKLDEAILGNTRIKKEIISIVTPRYRSIENT